MEHTAHWALAVHIVAVVAGQAGALCLAFFHPLHEVGLTDQRPGEGDKGGTGGQHLFCRSAGKDASHREDGYGEAFPGSQQAVQEEGGLLPVPAGHVQAAELDAVHAGGLEEPEQGRQVITAVVVHLDQEGKAGTTGVPDSQQDPADQPEPILQAAAIGILPVVPPEVQEAGEQIIVGTVDLDPIKARHLGRPGRMAELFHQPVQQLGREIAGGEGRPPVDAGARLPAAVADLGNEQGPVLVDPLGGQREEGGVRLLIQHRLPLICPLVPVHRQVARDDDAHSTPGQRLQGVHPGGSDLSTGIGEVLVGGGTHGPVFGYERAQLRSLEQRIGHKNASFFLNCTRKKGDVKELSEEKAKDGRAWRVGRQRVMGRKAEERGCKNASKEGERGLNRSF